MSLLSDYFTLKFDEIMGAGEEDALADCIRLSAHMAELNPKDAKAVALEYLITQILPCPKCEEEAFVAYVKESEYCGKCTKCKVSGPITTDCERDSAILLWNSWVINYKAT